jgi:TnpA family transposase
VGALDGLFRGVVDVALIREQWDQLVRVASSLKDRTTPAHVVLDRLAAGSPSDRLAKALTMLGRVMKTVSVLRYLHDSALRDRVHLQLNRGEHRHALTDRLFFGNQGEFRTGDREEMMNAVLVWNSVRIAEIVGGLERSVARPVRPEILARVSPLWHGHVIANGSYHFGGRRARAHA